MCVLQVTDFVFFLGKAFLTTGMVIAAYNIFTRPVRMLDNTGRDVILIYPWLPIGIVGFITYVVTSIFFSVYAMAVDTLFLCFCKYFYNVSLSFWFFIFCGFEIYFNHIMYVFGKHNI